MTKLEKAVELIKQIALDDHHGYDQQHRNGPDYDCSSLVCTVLFNAGFAIGPYSYTGNMLERLENCKFVPITKGPWKPGDIHLTPGRHTCMSINEKEIAEASINEIGKTTGGKTGDQTGKEIRIRKYYTPSYGWDFHLRFQGLDDETDPLNRIDLVAREVLQGKWGNGDERKKKLENAGYVYSLVQLRVNQLASGKGKFVDEVAREVIRGDWGNEPERSSKLIAANYHPGLVQKRVNEILKHVKS